MQRHERTSVATAWLVIGNKSLKSKKNPRWSQQASHRHHFQEMLLNQLIHLEQQK